MKTKKKGQVAVWGFALMLGITIIILTLALAPAGQEVIDDTRGNTTETNYSYQVWNESSMSAYSVNGTIEQVGLDCENPSISNFVRGTCVITDFSMFYFFASLILIGGTIIVARIIL